MEVLPRAYGSFAARLRKFFPENNDPKRPISRQNIRQYLNPCSNMKQNADVNIARDDFKVSWMQIH
jgi:hypothetical protein